MSLQGILFDKLNETDLSDLIIGGVPESPVIDYKQETYGGSDAEKTEFLADASSFANTLGGDLVIGISEKEGLPVKIVPLVNDADTEVRRLEQIALSGIEPRLSNLRIRAVPVAGGHVIVVRVPRSFVPPHRVIARNGNRFWARAGTTKYEPNVEQLRHLFNDVPQLADRIRSFQVDRLMKITGDDTPIPLTRIGKVVVHVVSLPSFADGRMNDVVSRLMKGYSVPLPLDEVGFANTHAVNLDGYVNYTQVPAGSRCAYAQFFRNGAIEGVGELRSDDGVVSRFLTADLTNVVVSRVRQYLDVLKSFDMGLPVYVFLSICNATRTVHRFVTYYGNWGETKPLQREIVTLPDVYVESFDADVIDLMRPAFNALWNAVGLEQCDRYNDVGKWKASDPYALHWR